MDLMPTDNIGGDPAHTLRTAVRSTCVVGVISTIVGLGVVLAFGYFNPYRRFRFYFIGLGMAVWLIPGVLMLLATVYIERRRRAAVIGALAAVGVQAVLAACLLYATATLPPVSPMPIVLCVLWLIVLVRLLVELRRCFAAIRADAEHVRGFAMGTTTAKPLPVQPVDERQ